MSKPDSQKNKNLADIMFELRKFVNDRDWSKFHDPKNLSMAVVSEAGELADIFRWIRNDEVDVFVSMPENLKKAEEEIADIAIFLLLLCDRLGLDLIEIIGSKIEINRKNHPG